MTVLKMNSRKLALLLIMAVALALLFAIAAQPTSSNHNCVVGSDDYDQCIAQPHPAPTPQPRGNYNPAPNEGRTSAWKQNRS